jgi:hypothetical protein
MTPVGGAPRTGPAYLWPDLSRAMVGAMARLHAAGRIVGTHADAVMAVDPPGNCFTLEG